MGILIVIQVVQVTPSIEFHACRLKGHVLREGSSPEES
jgi:hypothetical protein